MGLNIGRYDFAKLQYYNPPQSFDDIMTFTDNTLCLRIYGGIVEYKAVYVGKINAAEGIFKSRSKENQVVLDGRKKDSETADRISI